jgi:hypothetical protein
MSTTVFIWRTTVYLGETMNMRNYEGEDKSTFCDYSLRQRESDTLNSSKFNLSMEKQVERLWCDAKKDGWVYNDFVVRMLEILMILKHRDELKLMAAAKYKQG